MKKKVLVAFLGFVMAVGIFGAGVSRVSAEPESMPVEEKELDQLEVEESEADSEETESGSEIESKEAAEEETSEEISEVVDSENVEEGVAFDLTGMKVTLENNLECDLVSVEISAFSTDAFSENLLQKDAILAAGETCVIGVPEEYQDLLLGMYNVRITQSDGEITEIPFVPLLEEVKGIIYEENGTILIRVRDERLEAEEEAVSEAEMRQRDAEASKTMADALTEEIEN